jgi:hypothetical protein
MTVPPNLKLLPISFDSVKERANERLKFGFSVNIGNEPYKLCDFLPTYGVLFEEALTNFTHWGWVDPDTILGSIKDIYEPEYGNEDVVYYDTQYYLNPVTVMKNTPFTRSFYNLAPKHMLKTVFNKTPLKSNAFDEDVLTCTLMRHENVTARWYPNLDCSIYAEPQWWWYQGNMFSERGNCLLVHFGGGTRQSSRNKKIQMTSQMKPYFNKGYFLNKSIGIGMLEGESYFFTVGKYRTLNILHDDNSHHNSVFSMDPHAVARVKHDFRKAIKRLSSQRTEASVPTRGSSTNRKGWSKYCHKHRALYE